MRVRKGRNRAMLAVLAATLACGGRSDPAEGESAAGWWYRHMTFSVGGTLSGLTGTLPASDALVLQDNGTGDLALTDDGPFRFSSKLGNGSAYAVTVSRQPPGYTCSVSGGDDGAGGGTITGANVTSVAVTCAAAPLTGSFTVGGTVSGGWGTMVLQDNGTDNLNVNAGGVTSFVFAAPLADGSSYSVTVATPPAGRSCWVTNGTGAIGSANVTNVTVYCSNLSSQGIGCVVDGTTGLRTGWCADDGGCGGGPSPQCTGSPTESIGPSFCGGLIEMTPCLH